MAIEFIYDSGYTNHVSLAIHPDGTVFAAVNKTVMGSDRKNRYNLHILRMKPNAQKELIREYVQGVDSIGPFGYSAIALRNDGALVVGLSITHPNGQVVFGRDILPNVAPAFDATDNTPVPQPAPSVDNVARELANQAITSSGNAVQVANAARERAEYAKGLAADALSQIADFDIPASMSRDEVWKLIGDRLAQEMNNLDTTSAFHHDKFERFIRKLGTEALLVAINYAETNPQQSSLRALIDKVVNE